MAEKFNFSLGVPGRNPEGTKPGVSLYTASQVIKAKKYPVSIEAGLLRLLSKQPQNTYERFLRNLYTHLRRLQKTNEKEKDDGKSQSQSQGESNPQVEEVTSHELLSPEPIPDSDGSHPG